jgi:hypothetical protein
MNADLVSLRDWLAEWIVLAKMATDAAPAHHEAATAYRLGLEQARKVMLAEIEHRIADKSTP